MASQPKKAAAEDRQDSKPDPKADPKKAAAPAASTSEEDKKPDAVDPKAAADAPKEDPKDEGADDDASAAPDDGDDWRTQAAGGDEKLLKRLQRFDSLAAMGKSLDEAEKKLRERGFAQAPAADAPVEEKAKFYTQHLGRPEKIEAYAELLKPVLPEGEEFTDDEAKLLDATTAILHNSGTVGLDGMQAVYQAFSDIVVGGRKEQEKMAASSADVGAEALKKAWGRDFDANLRYANAASAHYCKMVGVDPGELGDLRLRDGAPLGNHPLFARVMARIGRESSEDPAFLTVVENPRAAGADIDKRIADINALRSGSAADKNKYSSEGTQKELRELLRLKKLARPAQRR